MKALWLLGALSILSGCSSYSVARRAVPPIDAQAVAPRDLATVCIVRWSIKEPSTIRIVYDDRRLVGATHGGAYFCYWAEPGLHRIVSTPTEDDDEDDERMVMLRLVAGRNYWLLEDYDVYFGDTFEALDEERARHLIQLCDYEELVEAPLGETIPDAWTPARALDTAPATGLGVEW